MEEKLIFYVVQDWDLLWRVNRGSLTVGLTCITIRTLQACETVPLMPADGKKTNFLCCTGLGPPMEGKQGIL